MASPTNREAGVVGKAVAAHRARMGFSRPGLARKLGLDRTYLWRIERGAVLPSLRVLDDLCALFGVSLDELRGRVVGPVHDACGRTTGVAAKVPSGGLNGRAGAKSPRSSTVRRAS